MTSIGETTRPYSKMTRLAMFIVIVAAGLSIDLGTKAWAFKSLGMPGGEVYWIIPDYVGFQTSLNEGALFGIGQGGVPVFVALSCCACIGIVAWLFYFGGAADLWLTISLGLVLGGVLGNLYDRIGMPGLLWNYPAARIGAPVYAVRDFFLFQAGEQWRWPNFNVADALLVVGAILLAIHAFMTPAPAEKPSGNSPSE